ncbi:MAG: hypothetical protein ACI9ZD_001868 [Paracoccaceae bacterium]|jgi:hypothetical protein
MVGVCRLGLSRLALPQGLFASLARRLFTNFWAKELETGDRRSQIPLMLFAKRPAAVSRRIKMKMV